MDRQPLTDRLGDRLLAEYGGAAAAYSLRALNGNGDSVVRVRRASDNDEEDFTAEQIELGEMVNWVNSQIVPPLDIGVLTPEGRIPVPEGGTSIGTPAAAYSLRNLSTTYTGNVVDVRRSSNNAVASFTAAEVADGTLTDWVNEDVLKYSSDFSSNLDGFIVDAGDGAIAGQTFEGESDVVKHTPSVSTSGSHRLRKLSTIPLSSIVSLKVLVYIPSSNTVANGVEIRNAAGDLSSSTTTTDEWVEVEATGTSGSEGASSTLSIHATSGGNRTFAGNGTDVIYYKNVLVTVTSADGFVSKWYDQSGNDNHATQGTAASQPKIVDGGALVKLNGKPTLDWGIAQANGLTLDVPISYSYANFVYKLSAVNSVNYLFGGQTNILSLAGSVNANFQGITLLDSTFQQLANAEDTNTHLGVYYNDGANNFLAIDGNVASSVGSFTSALNFNVIGNATLTTTGSLNGLCSELILYPSDQSANRTAIEANIGETYGITGIPAYDNTVDGFVETWYDQSGNGNDATQSVAASQPKIVDGGSLVSGGLDFDGVDDYLLSSHILSSDDVLSLYAVGAFDDLTQRGRMVGDFFYVSGSDNGGFVLENDAFGQSGRIAGYGDDILIVHFAESFVTEGSESLFELQLASGSSSFYVNGSNVNTISATMNAEDGGSVLSIGSIPTGLNSLIGQIAEIIIYNADKTSDMANIRGNINAHYDIYA
jgi:hypothetical protein